MNSPSQPRPTAPASALADLTSPAPFEGVEYRLAAGDLLPEWPTLRTTDGESFSFFDVAVAGRALVLLVTDHSDISLASRFSDHAKEFALLGARCFVISGEEAALGPLTDCRGLLDPGGDVIQSVIGQGGRPQLIIVRPNRHVAALIECDAALACFETAASVCESLRAARRPGVLESYPPILVVPDIFSRDECRRLIDLFNARGQVLVQADEAIDYFEADYKMRAPDQMREDRVDHFFFEKSTVDFLLHRLQRIEVEVARCFQYRITKHETLRIARYEGVRAGLGLPHRDNIAPHQHRRFALSINLNTEEYEGGGLRFPEFGDRSFRPPTGAGFVFSSSLLHEATQVTAGTRFVLLSFMYGEA